MRLGFDLLRDRSHILTYHSVHTGNYIDNKLEFNSDAISVSADLFEEQICYLSKNYNCISLSDYIDKIKADTLPNNSIAITFDDGYKNNLTVALPILKKHQVPATIFIASGLIDRSANLWWLELEYLINHTSSICFTMHKEENHLDLDSKEKKVHALLLFAKLFRTLNLQEQVSILKQVRANSSYVFSYDDLMLTWDEVRNLSKESLITIGAHTVNHPVLRHLSPEHLTNELRQSKIKIEEEIDLPVEMIAYPYGLKSDAYIREFEAAKSESYVAGFTTNFGRINKDSKNNLFSLPRISIGKGTNITELAWLLNGFSSNNENDFDRNV